MLRRAPRTFARTAQVDDEQGDGECRERGARHSPRPWPGKDPRQQRRPHHRRPCCQSSTRAQTATTIPASARAMNSQRSVSR